MAKKNTVKKKPTKKVTKNKTPKRKGMKTTNNRISNYYPPSGPVGYDKINYGGG